MCTDAARTYAVGKVSDEAKTLIEVTRECFYQAIKGLKAKSKVGDIGERIEAFIDGRFGIVQNYFGHGVGEKVHEEPLIPHFKTTKHMAKVVRDVARVRLPVGSVIAIEPMINAGGAELKTGSDGWTAVTVDGSLAAHFENTLIITEDGVEVVTE